MIEALIRWSLHNRLLVLLVSLGLGLWGAVAAQKTPLDAIPDLSEVQVIVRTTFPGQAPQIVESQVTYPLATTMLSVPGARAVRGISFFGDSFVYILFEDGTDLYWARSRVLEYLNQVQSQLPAGAKSQIGPDATGVGWVYQYALIDRTGRQDLAQLRSLQDWFLRYELKSVPGVSEVATVGGMVRQYQVVLDPERLAALGIGHEAVVMAINAANAEVGGSIVERGESEYMVRTNGYLRSLEDFQQIPLRTGKGGIPVRLSDVAQIQVGPDMRRGIGELDGEGEAVGGVIVMRAGSNALEVINGVKQRLAALAPSLPQGVEVVPVYDRGKLIERAVDNLQSKLITEIAVVAVVCMAFLLHLRSSIVAVVSLPLGVAISFIIMQQQGITANVMSLGGIAIAIGAMVDAAVVLVENVHKHLERYAHDHGGASPEGEDRWRVVQEATLEVGPALFFSLLVITLSFLPVFTLQAQEGRLFAPLAYTKTYAMAVAAGLAVTLVPVLSGYLVRGRIPSEDDNPISRGMIRVYKPALRACLARPITTLVASGALLVLSLIPLSLLKSEFMPPLDEGDLLYMPSALPGISVSKVGELLQQTDRLIKTVPEVERVYGKAGRAETATDPAPLEMLETIIQFKPKDQWRPGMTQEKLVAELDAAVRVPGLTNIWVPPIRNRIDMLSTGIKSTVGIKVLGDDLATIDRLGAQIEALLKAHPDVGSVLAERLEGGRYIDVDISRTAAARYGMNIADVQSVVSTAIGGMNIGQTIEGLQRYPIQVRYPREVRDSLERLRELPIVGPMGQQLVLSDVASLKVSDGPPMLRSENGRLAGFIYIDLKPGASLGSAVRSMQNELQEKLSLPGGYALSWSGQFEYLERAVERLVLVVPATLLVILVLLIMAFRRLDEALLVMVSLPFALVGGVWLLWALSYPMSVAVAVGFIALAGVAAEFGVIMLVYLKQAWTDRGETQESLLEAIEEGAVMRVRPKAMTVVTLWAGLLPIMLGSATGDEVMQRIAAPMIGGMVTAPILSLIVIPVAYLLLRRTP